MTSLRRLAKEEGLAKLMEEQDLDLLLTGSDSNIISFSACAGWPVATVPVSNLRKNGQPWGLFALPRAGSVETLAKFVTAFHASFEGIQGPMRPFEDRDA